MNFKYIYIYLTRRNPANVLEAPTCYGGALALDPKQLHSTERDIQRALDAASVGLTMVVVAHRCPDNPFSENCHTSAHKRR